MNLTAIGGVYWPNGYVLTDRGIMGIRKVFVILGMVAVSWLLVLGTIYVIARAWGLVVNRL